MAALVLSITAGLLALAWRALSGGGWTWCERLVFACFAANAPWLGLLAATGIVGFVLPMTTRDPSTVVVPALRRLDADAPITARVALCLCMRLEDPADTFPPAEGLLRALRGGPDGDRFRLALLSDTPSGAAAEAEAEAAAALAERHPPGSVFYRRRERNTGFKAGNLMDFLDAQGRQVDFVLVLDADSVMSAASVRRLVRVMQADARLAILQLGIGGCDPRSSYARLCGVAHLQRSRIWGLGQAWWQGPHGPYWGHNALLRAAPFRAHCRLPMLPGGQMILSHDHVEAALLHRAGWAVRVLPEDAGSAERLPPDLVATLQRDLRWAEGNLQYRHLLRRQALGRLGRLQMVQAILFYGLAPLWAAMLPLTALNVVLGGGAGTDRGAVVALLVAGYAASNLPKLAGFAVTALGRWPGTLVGDNVWTASRRWAGVPRRNAQAADAAQRLGVALVGRELLFSLLTDPVSALDRGITALRVLLPRTRRWEPQQREATGVSWRVAARRFSVHTALGVAATMGCAAGGWFPLLAVLPATIGLMLSVPVCVLTSRPASGRSLVARGWWWLRHRPGV